MLSSCPNRVSAARFTTMSYRGVCVSLDVRNTLSMLACLLLQCSSGGVSVHFGDEGGYVDSMCVSHCLCLCVVCCVLCPSVTCVTRCVDKWSCWFEGRRFKILTLLSPLDHTQRCLIRKNEQYLGGEMILLGATCLTNKNKVL